MQCNEGLAVRLSVILHLTNPVYTVYKKTLRYNFRIKPTLEQEVKLIKFSSYARGLWNLLLSENMRRYQYDKTFLFYVEIAKSIKELKKSEEFSWLKAFDSKAAQ